MIHIFKSKIETLFMSQLRARFFNICLPKDLKQSVLILEFLGLFNLWHSLLFIVADTTKNFVMGI